MRKIVYGLGVVLLVCLAAGVIIGIFMVRKSFPTTDGHVEASGIRADVQIFRDAYGVPHLFASSEHDL
jgi:penicillin amidase